VLQCIVNGKENPKIAPSPWDFVTLPEEDQATAIDNMHRKIGKDHACGSGDILMDIDRQTDTQTCSSQYFATALTGEVITLAHKAQDTDWNNNNRTLLI